MPFIMIPLPITYWCFHICLLYHGFIQRKSVISHNACGRHFCYEYEKKNNERYFDIALIPGCSEQKKYSGPTVSRYFSTMPLEPFPSDLFSDNQNIFDSCLIQDFKDKKKQTKIPRPDPKSPPFLHETFDCEFLTIRMKLTATVPLLEFSLK